MRSEHGSATIVWIVILLALLATMAFLAVDRCVRDATLEAAQVAVANLEAKIEEQAPKEEEQAPKESDILTLSNRLDQAEIERDLFDDWAADAEAEARHLEAQIKTLKTEVTKLTRTNKELQREVTHYKNLIAIVVERDGDVFGPLPSPPKLTCTVESVNTEYKYVMLSVGRDDKVCKGNRFTITRNGQYVGEVQVNMVYPKSCSASFVCLVDYMTFQPGDQASTMR
jgi:hypothetical protein